MDGRYVGLEVPLVLVDVTPGFPLVLVDVTPGCKVPLVLVDVLRRVVSSACPGGRYAGCRKFRLSWVDVTPEFLDGCRHCELLGHKLVGFRPAQAVLRSSISSHHRQDIIHVDWRDKLVPRIDKDTNVKNFLQVDFLSLRGYHNPVSSG
ncbi:hypothetical protein RRG08_054309 [Elysia crispata]|uniref:Uncharacterized protein n=1 Tax=Elysia crispata TaxID=231223 RepID=A0AAE1E7X5_9GAST|nr:hypothetical protein RRG08_054309 [Elysia crispata]